MSEAWACKTPRFRWGTRGADSTLRRELKRGMEGEIIFDKIKRKWFHPEYCAAREQAGADWENAQKGTAHKFTNRSAEAFRHQIVDLKKSPALARHDLLAQGHTNLPCVRSVYNHIDHGDIGIQRGQTRVRTFQWTQSFRVWGTRRATHAHRTQVALHADGAHEECDGG